MDLKSNSEMKDGESRQRHCQRESQQTQLPPYQEAYRQQPYQEAYRHPEEEDYRTTQQVSQKESRLHSRSSSMEQLTPPHQEDKGSLIRPHSRRSLASDDYQAVVGELRQYQAAENEALGQQELPDYNIDGDPASSKSVENIRAVFEKPRDQGERINIQEKYTKYDLRGLKPHKIDT